MNQNDGKLVRINDNSEIKLGMACKLINCTFCSHSSHVFNITEKAPYNGKLMDCSPYNGPHFKIFPEICPPIKQTGELGWNGYHTFMDATKEGRLFAIVDEYPNFEETTVVKKKPLLLDKLQTIK